MYKDHHFSLLLQSKIFIFLLFLFTVEIFTYFFLDDITYNFKTFVDNISNNNYYIHQRHIFSYPNPNLSYCSYKNYSMLQGNYTVNLSAPSIEYLEKSFLNIDYGGHHYPKFCKTKQKVGIVVPYKNREKHLRIFLHNMHTILRRQYIDYIIFVVEPIGNGTFNRGKLINIGFVESLKLYNYDCFIFHDVDLIPESDKNLYRCSKFPRHMTVHINKFNYTLFYEGHFGGAVAFRVENFKEINGFNNNYWGWGYEDDDLLSRVLRHNMSFYRYPPKLSRYFMSKHERDPLNPTNPCRHSIFEYYYSKIDVEGLNSLNYELKKITFHKLFTKIIVDLKEEYSKKILNETVLKNDSCLLTGNSTK